MERRSYGNTGISLSVLGFGGILVTDETTSEASRLVSKAVDLGINYFDVAPQYGNAQEMLGPALKPYRQGVFLACKTLMRTAAEARADLENSLKLLETDYFDLYQLHAVTTREDVEAILGPGGALETAISAQKEGTIRYLGFSAHTEEAALALMEAYEFTSVLFPLNWATYHAGNFGKKVIDRAVKSGTALLALKALARRSVGEHEKKPREKCWYWPVESYEEAKIGLRFTLSLPVTAAVTPGHEDLFDWAVKAAEDFTPITEEEQQALAEKAAETPLIFDTHHSGWI